MEQLPAEIADRFLVEISRFCIQNKLNHKVVLEFATNIILISSDYYLELHSKDYKAKSNTELTESILRQLEQVNQMTCKVCGNDKDKHPPDMWEAHQRMMLAYDHKMARRKRQAKQRKRRTKSRW